MLNTNAVAVALVAVDGPIDKLELETIIPASDRAWLAVYQAKLAAGPTRKDEDMRFARLLERWAVHMHKQ